MSVLLCAGGCSTTLDPTIEPPADAATDPATEPEPDCVAFENAGRRYWTCIAPPASFDVARQHCARLGAELASVDSQEENDLLATSTAGLGTQTNLWLGGSRDDAHVWSWPNGVVFWRGLADGEPSPGVYVNWKPGEPNDTSTVSDEPERCLVLTLFDTQWNDRACSLELSYFCEAELPAP